jgi:hypothetical protein
MACNDPDHPGKVKIEEQAAIDAPTTLSLAPCSVTLFNCPVE